MILHYDKKSIASSISLAVLVLQNSIEEHLLQLLIKLLLLALL